MCICGMCLCVYVYVYMCICGMCMRVCVCVYVYVCALEYVYRWHVYACECVYMCKCVHVCMNMCEYMRECVYMDNTIKQYTIFEIHMTPTHLQTNLSLNEFGGGSYLHSAKCIIICQKYILKADWSIPSHTSFSNGAYGLKIDQSIFSNIDCHQDVTIVILYYRLTDVSLRCCHGI